MADTPVTIRFAQAGDVPALAVLAQLDSSGALDLPVLVAELDGRLRAALSLADGSVIADPFHPTSELLDLLHVRARQLATEPRAGRLRALRSVLSAVLPRATAA
jgi:hypothetical protein